MELNASEENTLEEGELSDDCEIIDEEFPIKTKWPPTYMTYLPWSSDFTEKKNQQHEKQKSEVERNGAHSLALKSHKEAHLKDSQYDHSKSKHDQRINIIEKTSKKSNRHKHSSWYQVYGSSIKTRHTSVKDIEMHQCRSGFWDRHRAAGHSLRMRGLVVAGEFDSLSKLNAQDISQSSENKNPPKEGPASNLHNENLHISVSASTTSICILFIPYTVPEI